MAVRQPFPIQPIRTGDRQIDGHANAVRQSVADLYRRVGNDTASRILAPDAFTQLYYPCDETDGTTLANRGLDTNGPVLISAGTNAVPGASAGLVSRYCARLYGADATRGISAATAGPIYGDSITISCWARLTDVGVINLIWGYWETTGGAAICALFLDASGIPNLRIRTLAGALTVTGASDMAVSAGQWHHLVGTYDGAAGRVFVDGNYVVSATSVSPVDWAYGGNRQWRVGYTNGATSMRGLVQELRVDNCARDIEWVRAAYAAGWGLAA